MTEIVSWALPLPGAAIVAGLNVAVMPAGGFAARTMAPLNPELTLVVTVTAPDAPWAIETEDTLGVTLNGVVTVSESELVFWSPPPLPEMVSV
jgi:hypothetical protein